MSEKSVHDALNHPNSRKSLSTLLNTMASCIGIGQVLQSLFDGEFVGRAYTCVAKIRNL